MGVLDTILFDLIGKDKFWVSRSGGDFSFLSAELFMAGNMFKICSECKLKFTGLCYKFICRGCGRTLCSSCIRQSGSLVIVAAPDALEKGSELEKIIKSCKFCLKASKRHIEKIYPSDSPSASPEPPSPCICGEKGFGRDAMATHGDCVHGNLEREEHDISSDTLSNSGSIALFPNHPSPISICSCPNRRDERAEDCTKPLFSSSSECFHDGLDLDSSNFFLRHECYSCRLTGSSPSDSPSRKNINHPRVGNSVPHEKEGSPNSQIVGTFDHQRRAVVVKPERRTRDLVNGDSGVDDSSISQCQEDKFQKPLDLENNGHIWFPPPPEDEDDEAGSNFFQYDDDDDEIGESGGVFSPSDELSSLFPMKEKHNEGQKEPIRSVIHGHFRALVLQLLLGEGIKVTKDNESDDWLDVVSNLAWQAANFVKPDTRMGGSMDPGDYVKVKCVASGKPGQSTLVKGVVCTKNIKHKRMISQYKNARLLLLGGSLEYQRVHNRLASFSTLLGEELDHLKVIISRIEALQTNVLLVEKSVSPYAQEYLLAKEISLVLNVKRPLLECIARCTGASITPSVDKISASHLGHCELFRLEKFSEEHEAAKQSNKRLSKTLMFFEGCPRRLGCTILLKGSCREELRKIKKVIQYAVFAAYHLSLETSFLADEGASLPKMTLKPSPVVEEQTNVNNWITTVPNSAADLVCQHLLDKSSLTGGFTGNSAEAGGLESSAGCFCSASEPIPMDVRDTDIMLNGYIEGQMSASVVESCSMGRHDDPPVLSACFGEMVNGAHSELFETVVHEERYLEDFEQVGENEVPSDYFSATESYQSLLVSFSSRCVLKGTVCERSRLLRIKFYGSFDKPLGRYLRDDLFDQASYCRSCKEPIEAHVQCYTHQRGSLTINVRRLASEKLPGQQDGKIWMWHRCLRCAHVDGVPPATRRVVMSDAAWGLSFGKFLELSFSDRATANRIASCGHSLQRDCLRFYGCGNMVAFFYYSPIETLSVCLPPLVLEFDGLSKQQWLLKEAAELVSKMETLYAEIAGVLHNMEKKHTSLGHGSSDSKDLNKHLVALTELLDKEKNDYYDLLHVDGEETPQSFYRAVDILLLNSIWRSLLLASHVWEHRFCFLDSLLKSGCSTLQESPHSPELWCDSPSKDNKSDSDCAENISEFLETDESSSSYLPSPHRDTNLEPNISENYNFESYSVFQREIHPAIEVTAGEESFESVPSPASSLSEKIDSAWIGTCLHPVKSHSAFLQSEAPTHRTGQVNRLDSLPLKRLISPVRVYSFDSAMRLRERLNKSRPPSLLHLSSVRSFHGSGDHRSMLGDPLSGVLRIYSQISPHDAQKLSSILGSPLSYVSSAAHTSEGARLLLPQAGRSNLVIAVYDDEPTSIISYALSSKEHEDWVCNRLDEHEWSLSVSDISGEELSAPSISPWQSFGSVDLDYINYGSYGSEDASPRISSLFNGVKKSPHLRVSFEDESLSAIGKAKFFVTCYFAKQFDILRRKCCPSEVDFVSSLSRCKKWSAQGGKSNVYFAKSMDERFIIKQVTKTELESFEEFALEYFKYLNDSLSSGSPTCLAKVLGIYQVSIKNLRGGKETKMDLMVMENLFFRRSISRIYDLKGSSRSRYNQDTSGTNKVLLDMNLLETLRTNPIFLGSKAKRILERAVWNDTSFLASVDVMDYSLLVGVDEEKKELVIGIIDFMRQYTWDKHLETWVKASGILGGLKNASPTIISPKQYKRRFRKAMTTYFLTVPDQWSS